MDIANSDMKIFLESCLAERKIKKEFSASLNSLSGENKKKLISDTKDLIVKDSITFTFKGREDSIKIFASYAIQSRYLQRQINQKKFEIRLNEKFYYAVKKIKKWLKGHYPLCPDILVLKSTFQLARKWKLGELCYYLVNLLDRKYTLKDIIDLIFKLDEDKKTNSGLYLKCKILLQKNHTKVFKKHLDYLSEKRNDDNNQLFCLILGGFPDHLFPSVQSHGDFKSLKNGFNLKPSFLNHLNLLLTNEKTKNLLFHTTDNKIVKVHKEIIIKNDYFKAMLTNKFKEGLSNEVRINIKAKYLTAFVIYIYVNEVDLSDFNDEELLIFSYYCNKFLFEKLRDKVEREVKNRFSDIEITEFKILKRNSELEIENSYQKFANEKKFEDLQTKNKDLEKKNENYEKRIRDLEEVNKIFQKNLSEMEKKIESLVNQKEESEKKIENESQEKNLKTEDVKNDK